MTLLTCAALAILFSLSNKEILASTQNTLKKQLHESLKDIEWEDGSFDLDSDFYNLDGGVYLSLYTENGDFLFGRIPYGFSLHPDFSDGQIQTLSDAEKQWYIYDLSYRLNGYGLVICPGHFFCHGCGVQFSDYSEVRCHCSSPSGCTDGRDRLSVYEKDPSACPPDH